jgi:hypothetical protein
VRIAIRQAPLTLTATLERGRSLLVEVGHLRHRLVAGRPWTCRWSPADDHWKEVQP